MIRVAAVVSLVAFAAIAEAGPWLVLTRSYGCTDVKHLAETEKLSRVPTSPDEYADMMRTRGKKVEVGSPPGLAPHLKDKAVMIVVNGENRVFVQEELCQKPEPPQQKP